MSDKPEDDKTTTAASLPKITVPARKTPLETIRDEVTKALAEATLEVKRLEKAAFDAAATPASPHLHEAAHHARLAHAALGEAEGGLNKAWWKLRQAQDHSEAADAAEGKVKP